MKILKNLSCLLILFGVGAAVFFLMNPVTNAVSVRIVVPHDFSGAIPIVVMNSKPRYSSGLLVLRSSGDRLDIPASSGAFSKKYLSVVQAVTDSGTILCNEDAGTCPDDQICYRGVFELKQKSYIFIGTRDQLEKWKQ